MLDKRINIFEFPTNPGLKKKEWETEPGVKQLPGWLKKLHFHKKTGAERILNLKAPDYSMDLDETSGVRNADKIVDYALQQSTLLMKEFDESLCIHL